MNWIYLLLAVVAGAIVPLQAGVNVRLRQAVDQDAILAALVSFGVGTLTLLAWGAVRGGMVQNLAQARGPWWMWTGGLMGAFFVAATIVLAQRLGAASMLAWIIASQLAAGVIMDHYGVVGFAVREISPLRIAGVVLLVVGAVLIQK